MINDVNRIQFFCNAAPKRQQCYFSTFWAQFCYFSTFWAQFGSV